MQIQGHIQSKSDRRFFRGKRGCALLSGIALWLLLAGCAGLAPRAPQQATPWRCDPEADAALNREAYQLGIRLHEQFLRKHPDNALAWYHLGYAFGQTGDHAREIACYQKARELGYTHDDGLFFNAGMAWLELNRLPQALEAFEQALALNPEGADNHFGLALAHEAAGDNQAAEARFRQAISLDPAHLDARLHLAMHFIGRGNRTDALAQLQAVLAQDPQNPQARQLLEALGTP